MKTLALIAPLFLLCSCVVPPHYGSAATRVFIANASIASIESTAETVTARNGYRLDVTRQRQELAFVGPHASSPGSRMMSFLRGGHSRLWIIAQPRADGWTLIATSEPEGTATSFNAASTQRLLDQIAREVATPP